MVDCPDGSECVEICSKYISVEAGIYFQPIFENNDLMEIEMAGQFKKSVVKIIDQLKIENTFHGIAPPSGVPEALFDAEQLSLDGYADNRLWEQLFDGQVGILENATRGDLDEELKRVRLSIRGRINSQTIPGLDIEDTPITMGCTYDKVNKCWKKEKGFAVVQSKPASGSAERLTVKEAIDGILQSRVPADLGIKVKIEALGTKELEKLEKIPIVLIARWAKPL